MAVLLDNQATLWLILGFVLLATELIIFGFASGVLLFGSLGALLTGVLMWMEFVPNTFVFGISCFALSTTIITGLLWLPFKSMQSGSELGNDRSSDLIGLTFTASSEISHTQHGKHKYSGIQWRVEPSKDYSKLPIDAGTQVRVTAVSAGVFFVEPNTDFS